MYTLIVVCLFGVSLSAGLGAEIADCGPIGSFRVAPYVALAVELQALPKQEAIKRMLSWADSGKYDQLVIILCRMLFEALPGAEFRRPLIGAPQFFGKTSMADWPLEPITLSEDVPFDITGGYTVAGHPEEASIYFRHCLAHAAWTGRRYRNVNKKEIDHALQALLDSAIWKQPLLKWEQDRLKKQTE